LQPAIAPKRFESKHGAIRKKSVIDKVRFRGGLTEKGNALLAHYDAGGNERVA